MDQTTAPLVSSNLPSDNQSPVPFNYSQLRNRKRKFLTIGIFAVFGLFLALSVFAVSLSLENRSKAGFVNYPFFEMVPMASNQTSKSYDIYLDGSGVPATTAIHTVSLTLGMGKPAVYGETDTQEEAVLGDTTTIVVQPGSTGGSLSGTRAGISDGQTSGCCSSNNQCVSWFGTGSTCSNSNGACASGLQCKGGAGAEACGEKCSPTDCGRKICVNTPYSQICNAGCGINPSVTTTPITPCGSNAKGCPAGYACTYPVQPTCPAGLSCAQVMMQPYCSPIPTPSPKVSCTPRPSCLDQKPPCKIETFANPNWCTTTPTPTKTATCDINNPNSCGNGQICAQDINMGQTLIAVLPACIPNTGSIVQCSSKTQCADGLVCYQPSMPPCPSGMACAQVMPAIKCVRATTDKTVTPSVTTPTTSNYSVIYKDGAGTAISAYTGGSSIGIFTWDQVTANPNGLGLVMSAKVLDNAGSQKALHTRFKVGNIVVPINTTPQVAAQSIRGTIAGVSTDVELYQPKVTPTVTTTPTPTSLISCKPGDPKSCPTGWSCLAPAACPPANPNCGAVPPHCVQNSVVTPTPTTTQSCSPTKPCPSGMRCYQPTCAKGQICPQIQANMYCVPITPTPAKPTPITVTCTPRPSCLDQKPPCKINSLLPFCTPTPTQAKPTPTCTPRPSCLDANPPCKIETFANPNWCTPTPTPSKTTYCSSNADCPTGNICYQPPMPPCPSGMACTQVMPRPYCVPANTTITPTAIGGQKDEHGCLISGGYSWCEPKQKCLRIWEEPCTPTTTSTVTPTPTAYVPVPTPTVSRPWYCGYIPFLCQRIGTNQ